MWEGCVVASRQSTALDSVPIRELRAEVMGLLKIGGTLGVGTSVVQRVLAAD
jgi:hypothetical protein